MCNIWRVIKDHERPESDQGVDTVAVSTRLQKRERQRGSFIQAVKNVFIASHIHVGRKVNLSTCLHQIKNSNS